MQMCYIYCGNYLTLFLRRVKLRDRGKNRADLSKILASVCQHTLQKNIEEHSKIV